MVGDLIMSSLNRASYGADSSSGKSRKAEKATKFPVMFLLAASVVVPLFIFVFTFYLRSFDVQYQSADLADIICGVVLFAPLFFAYSAFSISTSRSGDARPMILLCILSIVAWILGFVMGGNNFHVHMQPFYDINRLNVYPSVDPSMYGGQQMMDAGQIEFVPGTHLGLNKSMGFKDGDTYCVAPIVTGNKKLPKQTNFDFWAVGLNCCSGHLPDFHCGEFANPKATKGLRLMDNDKRDMFRLVVQKASAEFNMQVTHPVFMYWLSSPDTEVQAYQDDGYGHFLAATSYFFCALLLVVVCAAAVFARN